MGEIDISQPQQRIVVVGKGNNAVGTDNSICTSKYNLLSFFPIAIREQFRRNGNLYFLFMGCLMFLGTYTPLFESSVSPWTTLGPLAIVISISLCQEAAADWRRHRSDHSTNYATCVVLRRAEEIPEGKDRDFDNLEVKVRIKGNMQPRSVQPNRPQTSNSNRSKDTISSAVPISEALRKTTSSSKNIIQGFPPQVTDPPSSNGNAPMQYENIAFQKVKRKDIRAGDIVLIKNREMVPADIILLASSGENGAAYIETSPIDGETNLKLRNSPHLPIPDMMFSTSISDLNDYNHPEKENIQPAVKRLTRMTLLGHPDGISSLQNPNNPGGPIHDLSHTISRKASMSHYRQQSLTSLNTKALGAPKHYVATLTSEMPNASVNTFSGKITLPPHTADEPSIDIPLDSENILLRGAMLRNTEWVLGTACFTGSDTKLAKNSIKTPSKFSRLDELMNRTVIFILFIMLFCVIICGIYGFFRHKNNFGDLWYAGFAKENTPWPYLPTLVSPKWRTAPPPFHQFVFTYITLLNNFVPLSLYVTVEMITLFMMYMIGWDRQMYHAETDTAAVARSTIVTDLGQVKYVFSDKTGTLTQNVMHFKRCSVDGSIFGSPIVKPTTGDDDIDEDINVEQIRNMFHSLKQLLVGSISLYRGGENQSQKNDDESPSVVADVGKTLTFNAEMFLRVMSICHTVVVEKEIDASKINTSEHSDKDNGSSSRMKPWRRNRSRCNTAEGERHGSSPLGRIVETRSTDLSVDNHSMSLDNLSIAENYSVRTPVPGMEGDMSVGEQTHNATMSVLTSVSDKLKKSADGSPSGFAYQAESPDEGALVSSASLDFGFQLISRDTSGVKISTSSPSILANEKIAAGLKNGSLTPRTLSAETACPANGNKPMNALRRALSDWCRDTDVSTMASPTEEVWSILAVNKFDSDRKRMSVLVRSPKKLGSIPMLLVKGADTSMLDPTVCEAGKYIADGSIENMNSILESSSSISIDDGSADDWEKSVLLNIQSHLGVFATEGLRTLVLGVRILTEQESDGWLAKYKKASTSIDNRDEMLTAVAKEIERNIHIVGCTAIEDKLQDGVPQTIFNIARAGIKLWVLTGDKRETAIEIGHSTQVLNAKMHVTDVADGAAQRVRALVAMEFFRLVKMGKLSMYQKNAKLKRKGVQKFCAPVIHLLEKVGRDQRSITRAIRRFHYTYVATCCCCIRKDYSKRHLQEIEDEVSKEAMKKGRHQEVRELAEKIIEDYKRTNDYAVESMIARRTGVNRVSMSIEEQSEQVPEVFHRANNANTMLDIRGGSLNAASLRTMSLASISLDNLQSTKSEELSSSQIKPVLQEDIMSLQSYLPGNADIHTFNKKKRSVLEKLFAVDPDVRKGKLVKHLTKDKKLEHYSQYDIMQQQSLPDMNEELNSAVPRALVIEGLALAHFLGDPLMEEILFAVASSCESVIACRVSPKQKALLVKLVKQFIVPTPVTLAIGDGANDVGMIQEAQIGVGISGLEGQQAVNASDFSIAQFRFLEDLLLVHGRWDFMRLSKVVLFSFYKNAVLAGLLIVYSGETLYSGQPLFDMWALSSFNFVNFYAIFFFGMFDRDVDKQYVKEHPFLYAAGPNNEHMAFRVTMRWMVLVVVHVNIIYHLAATCLSSGTMGTSAFQGLMSNNDRSFPGDGEGGGLKVFGNLVFTALNWVLSFKVLFESGAIIHGKWPAILGCFKSVKDGFWSRLAWTWHGIFILCIGFNFLFIYVYQLLGLIGQMGASNFSQFIMVTYHTFHTRSISWVVLLLVVFAANIADVVGKLFSNMFYPTQTQIHREIQVLKYNKMRKEEQRIITSPDHEEEI